MILRTKIKGKIYQYFTKRYGMYNYRRGWLKGDCPSCGEHKYGVNVSMNRSNCFKCGYHGDMLSVIGDIENIIEEKEVLIFLNTFEGEKFYEEIAKPFELSDNVTLPESYHNIRRGDSIFAKKARAFVKRRGFDVNKVSRKGWGYCTRGKYMGYIIMPFYNAGRLIYFNARNYMLDGPKFNNPLIEDFGLGKNMLIYNIDALGLYDRVFLFEGLMNAETIGNNAIAMGGKKVSNYQINCLIKSPVEKFIICLDDDAFEDAIKLTLKLVQYKKVKLIRFPEGLDANDLGRRRTLNIVNKNQYLTHKDIIKIKNEYS